MISTIYSFRAMMVSVLLPLFSAITAATTHFHFPLRYTAADDSKANSVQQSEHAKLGHTPVLFFHSYGNRLNKAHVFRDASKTIGVADWSSPSDNSLSLQNHATFSSKAPENSWKQPHSSVDHTFRSGPVVGSQPVVGEMIDSAKQSGTTPAGRLRTNSNLHSQVDRGKISLPGVYESSVGKQLLFQLPRPGKLHHTKEDKSGHQRKGQQVVYNKDFQVLLPSTTAKARSKRHQPSLASRILSRVESDVTSQDYPWSDVGSLLGSNDANLLGKDDLRELISGVVEDIFVPDVETIRLPEGANVDERHARTLRDDLNSDLWYGDKEGRDRQGISKRGERRLASLVKQWSGRPKTPRHYSSRKGYRAGRRRHLLNRYYQANARKIPKALLAVEPAKDTRCPSDAREQASLRCESDRTVCLGDAMICDGHQDCPRGEDESFALCVMKHWMSRVLNLDKFSSGKRDSSMTHGE